MRAVILTQYFPPEMGAAQNRLIALARAFRDRGHHITVLTALPNYPSGKIFEEYRKYYKKRELIEDIEIIRSWLYVHPTRSTVPTVLSYLTFAFSAYDVGWREIDSADILLWEYPPIFLGQTALKLAQRWDSALITNIADLWTRLIREHKYLSWDIVLKRFENFEMKLMRESLLVTAQTEGLIADIKSRLPQVDPLLWPNGADTGLFKPMDKDRDALAKYNPANKFVIGYAGLHGRNHNLISILQAAKILRDRDDIIFLFFGDGYEKSMLIEYARENDLKNVHFHDPVPHHELPKIYSIFDFGLVSHKDLPGLKIVRSAKMFEMMAAGIPILHCGISEGSEIVKKAGAGVVVEKTSPESIAHQIEILVNSDNLKSHGKNGRDYIVKNLERTAISAQIVENIESALNLS